MPPLIRCGSLLLAMLLALPSCYPNTMSDTVRSRSVPAQDTTPEPRPSTDPGAGKPPTPEPETPVIVRVCGTAFKKSTPPTRLDCKKTYPDAEDIEVIREYPQIVELELSYPSRSGVSAPQTARLEQIEVLHITYPVPEDLRLAALLPKLDALHLKNFDLPETEDHKYHKYHIRDEDLDGVLKADDFEVLSGHPSLRTLSLTRSAFPAEVLAHLGQLSSLRNLDLHGTSADYRLWSYLSKHPNLEQLNLSGTNVSDTQINQLLSVKTLRRVDLRESHVSDEGVAVLREGLPNTEFLHDSPVEVMASDGITLWSNGMVQYDGKRAFINEDTRVNERWPAFGETDSVELVPFDARRKAIYLLLDECHYGCIEDPPWRQVVYLIEPHGLVKVFDDYLGTYGTNRLRFKGNGKVTYEEDEWTAVQESGAMVHIVVLKVDKKTGKLEIHEKIPTGKSVDMSDMSACPFVYVEQEHGDVFIGEILRDVRGEHAYTLHQQLAVPRAAHHADGVLSVRITEEKQERTYFDELHVLVDGQRVDAEQCQGEPASRPRWCIADRDPHVMEFGDAFEATFHVGLGAREVILRGSGYYVPLGQQ